MKDVPLIVSVLVLPNDNALVSVITEAAPQVSGKSKKTPFVNKEVVPNNVTVLAPACAVIPEESVNPPVIDSDVFAQVPVNPVNVNPPVIGPVKETVSVAPVPFTLGVYTGPEIVRVPTLPVYVKLIVVDVFVKFVDVVTS